MQGRFNLELNEAPAYVATAYEALKTVCFLQKIYKDLNRPKTIIISKGPKFKKLHCCES